MPSNTDSARILTAVQEHATPVAHALADAIDEALPQWIARCVHRRAPHLDPSPAIDAARTDVAPRIRTLLLDTPFDEQRTTPLELLREAVRHPTALLRGAGIAPVERDDFARRAFPDDDYDLTPATWSDVDAALADAGIAWGAAKAWAHLSARKQHEQ